MLRVEGVGRHPPTTFPVATLPEVLKRAHAPSGRGERGNAFSTIGPSYEKYCEIKPTWCGPTVTCLVVQQKGFSRNAERLRAQKGQGLGVESGRRTAAPKVREFWPSGSRHLSEVADTHPVAGHAVNLVLGEGHA